MFCKNLKYYRLKKNLTKKELASLIGVTPMAITYYESGARKPNMETIKELASALGVRTIDFLGDRNGKLEFSYGEFRKGSSLPKSQEEYIQESIEEYMTRFFSVIDIMGESVLAKVPLCHKLALEDKAEKDAINLRMELRIPEDGPIGNLVELLENRGILVFYIDIDSFDFSGMNGFVNLRPFIVINQNMSSERMRSTIVHELAHLLFSWPLDMPKKEQEERATAISGAFLFSENDAKRKLGIRRSYVSKDMEIICKEYGISMYMLVKRAEICKIISTTSAKGFYIRAASLGWKKNEPSRIEKEEPMLFSQLVFRAVCEQEITIQKGAELLNCSYEFVVDQCFSKGI